MKAHFKYIFRAEMLRLIVFAVILVVNLTFIILGAFGVLPLAARIVAVSLSGTAIGTMVVFNIIGDISIINRIFNPPGAVFYALTPAPRKDRLLASIISMFVMDIVTLAASILGVIFLGLNLGAYYTGISVSEMMRFGEFEPLSIGLLSGSIFMTGYLYIVTLILFCKAVRRSVLYNKPAGGLLAFLLAVGVVYVANIANFLLAPFGTVSRYYTFFTIDVGYLGMGMYAVLTFIFAAVMFVMTARIMERKLNI